MKRGIAIISLLLLILPIASAGFFQKYAADFFNNENRITGNVAAAQTCADTDNGINLKVKGSYTNENGELIEDACNSSFLQETVCLENCNCQRILMRCPFNSICNNSKCVYNNEYEDTDNPRDYALDYNIFENGSSRHIPSGIIKTDACNITDPAFIFEAGSYNGRQYLKCPAGMTCVGGACTGVAVNCNELIPGWNSGSGNRFNIVLVGTDYHEIYADHEEALEAFRKDALKRLGINSPALGLFSIEPFKSNLNKFNFWYVDQFADADPFVQGSTSQENNARQVDAAYYEAAVASACNVDKKLVIGLVGKEGWSTFQVPAISINSNQFTPISFFTDCVNAVNSCYNELLAETDNAGNLITDADGDFCITRNDSAYLEMDVWPDPANPAFCQTYAKYYRVCQNASPEEIEAGCASNLLAGFTLAHEMGHLFGLADTYAPQSADIVPAGVDPDYPYYMGGTVHSNCFPATSEEECREKAPWAHLLGDGCGQEGIDDCTSTDLDYGKEVTCYPGCLFGVQSYRSIPAGIMPYGTSLSGLQEVYRQTEFGAWDEWLLQQSINAYYQINPPPTQMRVPLSQIGGIPTVGSSFSATPQYLSLTGSSLGSKISLRPQQPFSKGQASLQISSKSGTKINLRFENTFTVKNGQIIDIQGEKYRVSIAASTVTLKRIEYLPGKFKLKSPMIILRTKAQKDAFIRAQLESQHTPSG